MLHITDLFHVADTELVELQNLEVVGYASVFYNASRYNFKLLGFRTVH